MNRKQKKQIAKIVKEVLKKELPKIKKQLMREVKQAQTQQGGQGGVPQKRQPQPHHKQQRQQPQQQHPQQPQRPGQAQPAGNDDGLNQFKQIQEQMFEQGMSPAGKGGPTAKQAPGQGQQMSEKEMKQYAERLDPNGASANVQPDPSGGTIQQGKNESRQQFMQRLQQATGGKDPKKVFEESEKNSGGGNWRPGQDS